MLTPSRTEYLSGPPQPLMRSLPTRGANPFELFRRTVRGHRPSFLLESGKGTVQTARYSYFAGDPFLVVTGQERGCKIQTSDQITHHDGGGLEIVASFLSNSHIPRPSGVPPFFGGAVGYLSYDLARVFEPRRWNRLDEPEFPLFQLAFVELVAAVDHHTGILHLLFCPPLERFQRESREKLYREGCDRLAELEARLTSRSPSSHARLLDQQVTFLPEQTRHSYRERVQRCQEYIAAGDIYQANLSHRFALDLQDASDGHTLAKHPGILTLYQRLRSVNPSPFGGLVSFDDTCLISSSPERLVRLAGRLAETRPIAGTRPRGRDSNEDGLLVSDLLSNAKERAEHIMLVDLERNDMGKVCVYGSVVVDQFMTIEQYSHVSHIVSNVSGVLRPECTGLDLIKAVFPGGTITGVPKVRCMEIIDELEPVRRGPYTGAMGYLSWSGDVDLNILIRTLVLSRDRGYLQVGAGIVADSDPDREYEETLYKAEAFTDSLSQRNPCGSF